MSASGRYSLRRRRVRLVIVAVLILEAATVLWLRQTSLALLWVDSFGGAVAQVTFWAAPTLLLLILVPKGSREVAVDSAVSAVVLGLCWWEAATDWHSTASVGPGFVGFFILPCFIVVVRCTLVLLQWGLEP